MHAIVMVHKMQRMALSTNQLLPAKPVLPNSAPPRDGAEGDLSC
jgi:hypothetical protein